VSVAILLVLMDCKDEFFGALVKKHLDDAFVSEIHETHGLTA
jgi:hypothetical protein